MGPGGVYSPLATEKQPPSTQWRRSVENIGSQKRYAGTTWEGARQVAPSRLGGLGVAPPENVWKLLGQNPAF